MIVRILEGVHLLFKLIEMRDRVEGQENKVEFAFVL